MICKDFASSCGFCFCCCFQFVTSFLLFLVVRSFFFWSCVHAAALAAACLQGIWQLMDEAPPPPPPATATVSKDLMSSMDDVTTAVYKDLQLMDAAPPAVSKDLMSSMDDGTAAVSKDLQLIGTAPAAVSKDLQLMDAPVAAVSKDLQLMDATAAAVSKDLQLMDAPAAGVSKDLQLMGTPAAAVSKGLQSMDAAPAVGAKDLQLMDAAADDDDEEQEEEQGFVDLKKIVGVSKDLSSAAVAASGMETRIVSPVAEEEEEEKEEATAAASEQSVRGSENPNPGIEKKLLFLQQQSEDGDAAVATAGAGDDPAAAATAGGKKMQSLGLQLRMGNEKKRRQTVMMLDGEEPPKKPRAPRSQRMRRNNSFAGVIIGEKKAEEEDLERPRVVETWKLAAVESLLGNSSSSEAAATSSTTGAQQLLERSNSSSNSPPPPPPVEKTLEKTLAQEFSQQKQVIRAEEEQEQQSVDVDMPQQTEQQQELELGEVSGGMIPEAMAAAAAAAAAAAVRQQQQEEVAATQEEEEVGVVMTRSRRLRKLSEMVMTTPTQQADQKLESRELNALQYEGKQAEVAHREIDTRTTRTRKLRKLGVRPLPPLPPSSSSSSTVEDPPPPVTTTTTISSSVEQQFEFIRPTTVTKESGVAKLKRPSSARGFSTRNDMRSPLQDTSIERLQREATCRKLWQTPGDSELQRVPGSFASFDEYVGVFEPLLFEECRAQLHNSWEELVEGSSGDPFVPVSVKTVERRERGWYDVILMPVEPKRQFHFKEGDVAVLSTPKPGIGGRRKGRLKGGKVEEMEEGQIAGRIAGLVRRFHPIDVRDPPGAIFHFHVSQDEANHPSVGELDSITNAVYVLQQLQKGGIWYLAGLGSITTIQREYSALHLLPAFRPQMMNAILRPHPELFPGYADQVPPAMPDCFTGAFVQHLQRSFNTPQLAAIQWAAAHTAAGSSELSNTPASAGGGSPWPFTLVQGPPGTGKTYTVWGMLNVIHLVQYQRYYAALLQKLAPGSLVASEELSLSNGSDREYDGDGWGTIDEVLQKMDRSLARVLPKLCPKPRMLVCAPSNAATDELLSRVLDRGFIDGEMKVYRPDVARVGVDTSSRAAQAVSVERRTEQLLAMEQPQVLGWLQQLRTREVTLAQHVAGLQRDLIDTAAAVRSQGNMGVEPDVLAARDQMRDGKLQQLAAVVEERDKVLVEMSRLFIIEVKFRAGSNFRIEEARRKLEASFANEAEIVFTTVSSSGRKIFSSLAHGFDMVVIDEAAQASEVAVLPPLSLRAARCVLVGDPQQLPATVISRAADTMQYSRSLFERFQQAGCPAILLSVQYRMHPRIRDFPSRYFYQGRLVDSEGVQALPDEIYHKDSLLQPYLFFDVSHGRESHGGSVSYQNKMEAQVAIRLFEHLQKVLAEAAAAAAAASAGNVPPAKVSVGIITPYKQQLTCLEKEFVTVVGSNAASKGVYINTVDAFQGQERDVIIMSCVRASSHGVGFVADIRRMNVALTRARRSLWVIGNASALVQSEDWAALLADAKERGCFVSSATCITRGLLPEPPMGSTGILHQPPRSGPPLLSRGGRGMAPSSPMGGPHFLPGRHPFGTPPRTPGEEHWSSRRHGQDPVAFLERGDSEGQDLWQHSGQGQSCRGQREGARPGFGPTFQHPGRRSKDL